MLREGAVAQTTHDLREAEYKDAEAKAAGAQATVAKVTEQIRCFGCFQSGVRYAVVGGALLRWKVCQLPISPAAWWSHGNPARFQVDTRRLSAHTGGFLGAP